jgi:hypothetical protein
VIRAVPRRLRPADEQGIALVLAVLILAIVSIATSSVILYTTLGQQDAASKKSGTTAYALAQAALSQASTQLAANYYDSTGQPKDNTTTLSNMVSWGPSGSQVSPTDTTSPCPTAGTCMTWSSMLECPAGVSCSSGAPTYTPSGIKQALWHLTGTGRVLNPSGPGYLTRTITIDVPVDAPPARSTVPNIFKMVYSGGTSTGCDVNAGQQILWAAPVYIKGNLCFTSGAALTAGAANVGRLVVGGWIDLGNGNGVRIGTSTTPIARMDIGASCDSSRTSTPCTLTSGGGSYHDPANRIFVSSYSQVPTFPSLTAIDWTGTDLTSPVRQRGAWSCTGNHSLDPPSGTSFDITGTPYTCTTESGTLSWDGTTLTINGNVYINGNMVNTTGPIVYSGLGNIFVGGNATFINNTAICVGATDITGHDCPNQAAWPDMENNFLLILTHTGFTGGNQNFNFEGGIYSDANIVLSSGQTHVYGPMVTPATIDPGQQQATSFPDILNMFTGPPNTSKPFWTLGTPINGTY